MNDKLKVPNAMQPMFSTTRARHHIYRWARL